MNPILDDILSLLALVAANIAIALLLYGFAPEITAWAAR
jgi:hypothetical protein